ncbi:hypothetical protein N7520_002039 [Penicillium odoratum]|uniref:uncharacterized protein n=1 Tax=Penicillium odoratum TaxID=1167516 RepID=UPI002547B943|nr:uncharacterized protein N7520_002039 [Penicillium odoratum]KAJ5778793.1 hypothetical protein N7520_002039 [Penicillium odoratum]
MQAITLFFAVAQAAMIMAAPASDANTNVARGDSGCYPYSNPDCGVSGTFCQCANGDFYLFNESTNDCQPPWAYVTNNVGGLPGSYC